MAKKKEVDSPIAISYTYVGKKVDYFKELLDSIPEEFKPTAWTGYLLIIIFTLVISWGIIEAMAPIKEIANFDINNEQTVELGINVGFPLPFFYSTNQGKDIEMSYLALLGDTLLYLILSYLLDIGIKFLISLKLTESEEERRKHPKVFKFKEKSTSQKIADKVVEKTQETNTQSQDTNIQKKEENPPASELKELKQDTENKTPTPKENSQNKENNP